jgi:hypothetical protein
VIETGGAPIKYHPGGKGIAIPSERREARVFNGVNYIMEEAITGDYALVKVHVMLLSYYIEGLHRLFHLTEGLEGRHGWQPSLP